MAKLPPYCDQAREIEYLMRQGRRQEAIAKAVVVLRAGAASSLVQNLVAELLQPAPKGRGRPAALPWRWAEMGEEFEALRDSGVTHEQAIRQIADRFGRSESAVEKTVRMYRAAVKAAHED
jgi:hypothetical protein